MDVKAAFAPIWRKLQFEEKEKGGSSAFFFCL